MKNYTIIAIDTLLGTTKNYNYMDDMMASAKFYDVVKSNLWNKVMLVDNRTGEVLEESDEIPNLF